MIDLTFHEWRHAVVYFRFLDGPGQQHRPVSDMIVHDVYVEGADGAPYAPAPEGALLHLSFGKTCVVGGLASRFPYRTFSNPDDVWIDEDGERHLKTNITVPIHAHELVVTCTMDKYPVNVYLVGIESKACA